MVVRLGDMAQDARLDLVLHALSDRTRREILRLAAARETSVSELSRQFPTSFAAVQKHVAVLERARLVEKRRCGRERLVRTRPDALDETARALDGLAALFAARVGHFGELLATEQGGIDAGH